MRFLFIVMLCSSAFASTSQCHDTLQFSGQASVWLLHSSGSDRDIHGGMRYIPQVNLLHQRNKMSADMELSLNLNGSAAFRFSDTLEAQGLLKPYRIWARVSGDQYEFRLGLQKINFGSASLLRPLMWFDRLDPRDPLQLTDGVWAALARYYFLNNANAWLWIIKPESKLRTWELLPSNMKYPEWGARLQWPVGRGEAGMTFHQRKASSINNNFGWTEHSQIGESRLGIDGKWDIGPGIWFEGVWMRRNKALAHFTNQWMLTLGTDYTFDIWNGLGVTAEQLIASSGDTKPSPDNWLTFTALSFNMPITISDQLFWVFYADYRSNNLYAFASYRRQFKKLQLHCMAWWNPEQYALPNQMENGNLHAGKGFQLMLVYHH